MFTLMRCMRNHRGSGTIVTLAAVLLLTGCATTTRTASFGPLPGGVSLLTLVVTEDLEVVRRECAGVPARGQVLGCHIARPVPGGTISPLRAITIVRYAETAPSAASFEIDAHELCHTVAALQQMKDTCHDGNGGVLQASERLSR
jgi:hypothetical protein